MRQSVDMLDASPSVGRVDSDAADQGAMQVVEVLIDGRDHKMRKAGKQEERHKTITSSDVPSIFD
jgi:hypothetical protein